MAYEPFDFYPKCTLPPFPNNFIAPDDPIGEKRYKLPGMYTIIKEYIVDLSVLWPHHKDDREVRISIKLLISVYSSCVLSRYQSIPQKVWLPSIPSFDTLFLCHHSSSLMNIAFFNFD